MRKSKVKKKKKEILWSGCTGLARAGCTFDPHRLCVLYPVAIY